MEHTKVLSGLKIKNADEGTVEAVFSTFDAIDKDGDVTRPEAFEDGADVQISAYGHKSWEGALPVGVGTIRTTATEAILDGQFFMDVPEARATFAVIKGLAAKGLGQWSYGFDVVQSSDGEFDGKAVQFLEKLKVHEVSPVLLGAGVDTRTLAVKGKQTFPDEVEQVLGDMRALVTRVEGWGSDSDRKTGRVLSAANRERLTTLTAPLAEVSAALSDLLAETDPNKHADALVREVARYERLRYTN